MKLQSPFDFSLSILKLTFLDVRERLFLQIYWSDAQRCEEQYCACFLSLAGVSSGIQPEIPLLGLHTKWNRPLWSLYSNTYFYWIWYIPTNALFYTNVLVYNVNIKTLKTFQYVSISIQIIFRELVVSSLKSLSLKLLKKKVHYGNVAAYVWCVCMAFCVEM